MIGNLRVRRAVAAAGLFTAIVGLSGPAAAMCGFVASVAAVEDAARALAMGEPGGEGRLRAALSDLSGAMGDGGVDSAAKDVATTYAASMGAILSGEAPASSALSARQAGLARAVASAGAAAGCEDADAPNSAEDASAADDASGLDAPPSIDAVGSDGDDVSESGGARSVSAEPSLGVGERLGALSAVSLALPSGDGDALLRYLPFIALAFCLFFAFRIEDRRGHRRYRCSIPLNLPEMGDARLVDVSRAGAKIAAETPPGRGDRVALVVKGESMGGAVIWSNRSYFGLRFDRLLSEDAVSRLRVAEKDRKEQNRPAIPAGVAASRATPPPQEPARWYKT